MTAFPSVGFANDTIVHCIICQRSIPLTAATAGALYATRRQAFACRAHMRERARWIACWAAFEFRQILLAPTRPLQPEQRHGCRR